MEYKPYKNQNYDSIKSNCSNSRRLFEDPEFPATNSSIFHFNGPSGINPYDIKWLRPHQICSSPKFSIDGFDPKDLHQGSVGNCWFIAGAISITTSPKYLEQVVPHDQSFDHDYVGVFHFHFWHFGDWIDVVVDDRLPYWNGQLLYCSNRRTPNEFWGPLLEKAFAKLAGCYEFTDGGFTQDAIVDMTGGVTEYLDVEHVIKTESKDGLWKSLLQAHKMGSLSGANIVPEQANTREGKLSNGLIDGHVSIGLFCKVKIYFSIHRHIQSQKL
jgi:calpain-5